LLIYHTDDYETGAKPVWHLSTGFMVTRVAY
jgi:hypothetical protein